MFIIPKYPKYITILPVSWKNLRKSTIRAIRFLRFLRFRPRDAPSMNVQRGTSQAAVHWKFHAWIVLEERRRNWRTYFHDFFFEHIQMVSLAKGVQIGGLEMNTNRLLGYSRLDLQGWTSEKNVEFCSAFFVKCANSWRINDVKFFGRLPNHIHPNPEELHLQGELPSHRNYSNWFNLTIKKHVTPDMCKKAYVFVTYFLCLWSAASFAFCNASFSTFGRWIWLHYQQQRLCVPTLKLENWWNWEDPGGNWPVGLVSHTLL